MRARNSGDHGSRAAVAQALDPVSWEVFGLVMGCLEKSTTSSSSSRKSSNGSSNDDDDSEIVAALAEKLALELAEIFNPKELHIMVLEHLHAYSKKRQGLFVASRLYRPCFPACRYYHVQYLESREVCDI